MRIGLGLSEDLPATTQRQIARDVEAAGLASLWTNEASGRDALLQCQIWADATTTLEVGIGVVPIWTRSPAQLAMASATLQESSGGRFLLGLGVSHPATMGPWHGADVRKPRTAAKELLAILAALHAGEKVDVAGEVLSAQRFRLAISPLPAPTPRYLAAMGPRMLELAGSDADGVLLNWSGPREVAEAAMRVRSAAEQAGRSSTDVVTATYVRMSVHADREVARAALAAQVGQYAALPAYAAHFTRQGFGDMVSSVKAAFRDGGREAVPGAIDDATLSQLGWWGTPTDDPASALAEYASAGLDHLVARVVVAGDGANAAVRSVADLLTVLG